MKKRVISALLCILIAAAVLTGCAIKERTASTPTPEPSAPAQTAAPEPKAAAPKYIFMLIGDGMSAVQVNTAQVLNGNNTSGEVATDNLLFTGFPASGMATHP
jgi:alkaline phosphatase